jgi:protein SCO1
MLVGFRACFRKYSAEPPPRRVPKRCPDGTGAGRAAQGLPCVAMPARIRLALFVTATLVLSAAAGIGLFAGRGSDSASTAAGGTGFAGALRPDIPPQDFRLRDQDGKTVSLAEFRGRVVILTFMYTTCRDTCPLTATQIRGALDDLGRDVPALAVSVDPVDDTPERAREFLFRRGLSHDRMRFLLGSRAQLQPVWRAYGVRPQGNAFDHSAYVLLIDRHGRQRVGFPVAQLVPEELAHDIRRLEAEA